VFVQQSAYGRWGVTSVPCRVTVNTHLCSAAFLHHWQTSISDYSQYSMTTLISVVQQNRATKSHSTLSVSRIQYVIFKIDLFIYISLLSSLKIFWENKVNLCEIRGFHYDTCTSQRFVCVYQTTRHQA